MKETQTYTGSAETSTPTIGELLRQSELVRRQHDYAMVCASDKKATTQCQSIGHYYCSETGRIEREEDKGFAIPLCQKACKCINLNPKPQCVLGLVGNLYCLREVGNGQQEWMPVDSAGSGVSTNEQEQSMLAASDEVVKKRDSEAGSSELDQPSTLVSRQLGNSATMVCASDKEYMRRCAGWFGYYCSSTGALVHRRDRDRKPECEQNCVCYDLNPKPACILGLAGNLYCL